MIQDFVPPPHANAETHKLVMERVAAMTPSDFVQSLVQAGICLPDGQLTEHYRAQPKKKNGRKAA
jgi:hypothetical protein